MRRVKIFTSFFVKFTKQPAPCPAPSARSTATTRSTASTPSKHLGFTPIKPKCVACKTQLESCLTTLQACFKPEQQYRKLILVPNYTTVLPKTRAKFSTSSRKTNCRKQGGSAADSTRRRSNVTQLSHSFLDEYFEGNNFTFSKSDKPIESPFFISVSTKSPKIWQITLRRIYRLNLSENNCPE